MDALNALSYCQDRESEAAFPRMSWPRRSALSYISPFPTSQLWVIHLYLRLLSANRQKSSQFLICPTASSRHRTKELR